MAAGLSHKDTILIWNDAVQTFEKGPQHHHSALQTLQQIENPTSKILFNIGHINLSAGDVIGAVQAFKACIEKDPHLAIAHFQLGLCYYRQRKHAEAKAAYEKAVKCLRGNKHIDYKQLGMVYKLYECEVKNNMALSYSLMLNTPDLAIQILQEAFENKVEAKHNVIGTAITKLKQGGTFDPFTIPSNTIFCPPKSKVANLKNIDYLGKSKVVSELTVPETPGTLGRSRSPSPAIPVTRPVPPPPNAFRPIDTPPSPTSPLLSPPSGPNGKTSPNANVLKLKDSLVQWNEGIMEYDKKNFTGALDSFLKITEPSAKILFNMASLQVRLGQADAAANTLQTAISKDPHLAVAHCLLGNLYCKANRADDAWRTYEKCLECFRSNKSIDYKQLGMAYKLCQCEVLYNQAYTYAKLGEIDWCTKLLADAQKCKLEEKHNVIDTAIERFKQGSLFNIMDLPLNLVFRPPKDKVANLKKQDYLGKKKVVSELKDKKPPTPTLPTPPPQQIKNDYHEGELYLPMAPGPLKHENTYAPPARPPKLQTTEAPPPPPAAPSRSTSLIADNSSGIGRAPSPLPPNRLPPPLPPVIREDSFDEDSFDDDSPNDHFEDEYKSKPVPLPSSGFLANKPLPSPPGSPAALSPTRSSPVPPNRPVPSPTNISSFPQDRPVPQPPRKLSTGPPQKIPPKSPDATRIRKISQGPPLKPLPVSPRSSPVPPERPPPLTGSFSSPKNSPQAQRKISQGPPSKPLPRNPHRTSPGIPTREPPAPRSSPVPPERPPPPTGSFSSPKNSPLVQRKISQGPPSKPLPPNPHRTSPGLPTREPPAPPMLQRSPPPTTLPSPPPPPPPNKGLPIPPSKSLPMRPAKPRGLINGTKRPRAQVLERRLSTTHVVAVTPFDGTEEGMLSFGTGELIQVITEVDDNWLEGELRGCCGIFPREHVKEMSLPATNIKL